MPNIEAEVYFQDEAPRIGCGWRRVSIVPGSKWVRVIERGTEKRVRLPFAKFIELKVRVLQRPVAAR